MIRVNDVKQWKNNSLCVRFRMILEILLYVKEEEEYGGKLGLELGFDFKNKFYD